jgi:hypothetical protein
MHLDPTAGFVTTPFGVGKYVGYDPTTGTVIVEMDYSFLVEIPGEQCYPLTERRE